MNRILIIEGVELSGKILSDFFWFCGYNAEWYSDVESAIKAVGEKGYELIVIGSVSGIGKTELIKAIKDKAPGIPIIGLSSGDDEAGFIEAGIKHIVSRPLDLKCLMDEVNFMLDITRPHPRGLHS